MADEESWVSEPIRQNPDANGLAVIVTNDDKESGNSGDTLQSGGGNPLASKTGQMATSDDPVETPTYGETELDGIIKKKSPQNTPQKDSELYRGLDSFSKKVQIIIHTVNDNEYWAAVDYLAPPVSDDGNPLLDLKTSVAFPKAGTAVGMFGGYKAALVQTRMGEYCRGDVEDALLNFPNAKAIIAVGVAYGKSREKCKFGDVLVSQSIEDMSTVKWKDGIIIQRGEKHHVKPRLQQIFCKQTQSFVVKKGFTCAKEGRIRNPKIIPGTIVSMSWLVDDKETKMKILENSLEAIGGEMEGFVLLQIQEIYANKNPPRQLDIVVIKGVADYGDGEKMKEWQFTAAMAAVGYAHHKLEETGGAEFEINPTDATSEAETPTPAPATDDTVETDRAISIPSRRQPLQPDLLSSEGGNSTLQSGEGNSASKTGSQESFMDCSFDIDDFPVLSLQNSIWIFGSKFTNLITSNRRDEFSYATTVTSAFEFQKRFKVLPTNREIAIETLLQPPQASLRDERSHSKTLLNVAGILQTAFKVNPAQFSQWLRGRYSKLTPTPEGMQALRLLHRLVEKGARVATTAFDQQLAKSLRFGVISYSDKYKMDSFIRETEKTVLHLHGHFERRDDVVFSQSDHDQLKRNEEYCSQVEAMFRSNNVVLVGFDWPCLLWDPQLDLIVETGHPEKSSGASHFILAGREHCASYTTIKGVAVVPYQDDLLTYMEEWWKLLLRDFSSPVATDEVDERIGTPPPPKRPKIAISRQPAKEGPSAIMTHKRKRLSADDLLKTVVQEDLDEPELYDIADHVTSDIIEQLAVDLHGDGRQLDRIVYEGPKNLKDHAFRVLRFWYESCNPESGRENRKILVREMYKLKKFRLAEAIARKSTHLRNS